jgi:hypothetical protein
MNDTLVGKIVQQKLLAEAKYPDFAKSFLRKVVDKNLQLYYIKDNLEIARTRSDAEKPDYSIQSTLDEEVLEALEAAGEERWEDCMMELAQVGSVVLRAMEWVQNNKLNKETNNA